MTAQSPALMAREASQRCYVGLVPDSIPKGIDNPGL